MSLLSVAGRQAKLVDSLYAKTLENELAWEKIGDKTYATALKSGVVRLFPSGADFVVQIFDSNGTSIDRFSDVDLAVVEAPKPYESYFGFLGELHKLVSRQVSGADAVLDSLIADLE